MSEISEATETITIQIPKEVEKKIRDKAIEEGISIFDYIKKICIYKTWFDSYGGI